MLIDNKSLLKQIKDPIKVGTKVKKKELKIYHNSRIEGTVLEEKQNFLLRIQCKSHIFGQTLNLLFQCLLEQSKERLWVEYEGVHYTEA